MMMMMMMMMMIMMMMMMMTLLICGIFTQAMPIEVAAHFVNISCVGGRSSHQGAWCGYTFHIPAA
jgi:hypothetical protein